MSDYQIQYLEELPEEIDEKVFKGHVTYETTHGIVCNYQPLHIIIKDKEVVIGVLAAFTAYAEIYVEDIWVDANYRGAGLGTTLLQYLENYYKGKGYNNINLVTSQFQAPGFYKKCGFEVEFIRVNKYNPKLTKTFFVKYFDEEVQTQGILP